MFHRVMIGKDYFNMEKKNVHTVTVYAFGLILHAIHKAVDEEKTHKIKNVSSP